MPNTIAPALPFDPTGLLTSNKVQGEMQILTAANGINYHIVVPKAGPYFSDSISVILKDQLDNIRTLVKGIDYIETHQFISASRACAKAIYGSILILDLTVSGIVTLGYQSVGGQWTIDGNQVAAVLSDSLRNPRITAWEQVAGYPNIFPVISHQWNLTDMVGMSNVVNALDGIHTAIIAKTAAAAGGGVTSLVGYVSTPGTITGSDSILTAIEKLNGNTEAEIARALAAETSINTAIATATNVGVDLALENVRATNAEALLNTAILAEVTRAQAAEASLTTSLSGITIETTRAQNAENAINAILTSITNGSAGYVTLASLLNTQNQWHAQQAPFSGSLIDGAFISWDANVNGQVVDVVLAGNRVLNNPTNIVVKSLYCIRVTQDNSGSRTLTWGSSYKFGPTGAPTLSTSANGVDWLQFIGGANNTLEFVGSRINAV